MTCLYKTKILHHTDVCMCVCAYTYDWLQHVLGGKEPHQAQTQTSCTHAYMYAHTHASVIHESVFECLRISRALISSTASRSCRPQLPCCTRSSLDTACLSSLCWHSLSWLCSSRLSDRSVHLQTLQSLELLSWRNLNPFKMSPSLP